MSNHTFILQQMTQTGLPIILPGWDKTIDDLVSKREDPAFLNLVEDWRDLAYLTDASGKLKSSWSQKAGGRVYSSRPNLQGMPAGLRCQIGERGRQIVSVDLKSCHLLIAASQAGDKNLLADIAAQDDFYELIAQHAAKHIIEGETAPTRKQTKVAILAYLNGGGISTVLRPVRELFAPTGRYALVGEWVRRTREMATKTGHVIAGSRKLSMSGQKGHTGPSVIFQTLEFEIFSTAVAEYIKKDSSARILLYLHDEIVLSLPATSAEEAAREYATFHNGFQACLNKAFAQADVRKGRAKFEVGSTWGSRTEVSKLSAEKGEDGKSDRHRFFETLAADVAKIPTATRPTMRQVAKKVMDPALVVHPTSPESEFDRACMVVLAMDEPATFDQYLSASSATTKKTGASCKKKVQAVKKRAKRVASEPQDEDTSKPVLLLGDDAELAQRLSEEMRLRYDEVVFDGEGIFYAFSADNGVWKPVPESEISTTLQSWSGMMVGPGDGHPLRISDSVVRSVTNLLQALLTKPDQKNFFELPPQGVIFADGQILDPGSDVPRKAVASDRVREGDGLDFDYDPEAVCPRFDQFMREIHEGSFDQEDKIRFCQEWAGAAIVGDAIRFQRVPLLVGHSGSGKGAFMGVVRGLVPAKYQTSVNLGQLSGPEKDNYAACLYGKKLAESPDLPKERITDTSVFKMAVMGEPITARAKFGKTIRFIPHAAFILASEAAPNLPSAEDGAYRRIVPITHNHIFVADVEIEKARFSKDLPRTNLHERQKDLEEVLHRERPGILRRFLEAYKNLAARKAYIIPQSAKDEIKDYGEIADSVRAYIAEFCEERPGEIPVPTSKIKHTELYAHFKAWHEAKFTRGVVLGEKKFSSKINMYFQSFKAREGAAVHTVRLMPHRAFTGLKVTSETKISAERFDLDTMASRIREAAALPDVSVTLEKTYRPSMVRLLISSLREMAHMVEMGELEKAVTEAEHFETETNLSVICRTDEPDLHLSKWLKKAIIERSRLVKEYATSSISESSDLDALEMMN